MRLTVSMCILVLITWGTTAAAISDADKCEAAKNQIAGKYAFCRQKAEAKATKTGAAADYTDDHALLELADRADHLSDQDAGRIFVGGGQVRSAVGSDDADAEVAERRERAVLVWALDRRAPLWDAGFPSLTAATTERIVISQYRVLSLHAGHNGPHLPARTPSLGLKESPHTAHPAREDTHR